jgi:hypothetical protein
MPLELIPPRQGRKAGNSPNWRVRGTYLGTYVDRTTGTSKRGTAFYDPNEMGFAEAASRLLVAGSGAQRR